jgi:hypothetical protein
MGHELPPLTWSPSPSNGLTSGTSSCGGIFLKYIRLKNKKFFTLKKKFYFRSTNPTLF